MNSEDYILSLETQVEVLTEQLGIANERLENATNKMMVDENTIDGLSKELEEVCARNMQLQSDIFDCHLNTNAAEANLADAHAEIAMAEAQLNYYRLIHSDNLIATQIAKNLNNRKITFNL